MSDNATGLGPLLQGRDERGIHAFKPEQAPSFKSLQTLLSRLTEGIAAGTVQFRTSA